MLKPLTLGFFFGFRFPSLRIAFLFLADAISALFDLPVNFAEEICGWLIVHVPSVRQFEPTRSSLLYLAGPPGQVPVGTLLLSNDSVFLHPYGLNHHDLPCSRTEDVLRGRAPQILGIAGRRQLEHTSRG